MKGLRAICGNWRGSYYDMPRRESLEPPEDPGLSILHLADGTVRDGLVFW